MSLSKRVNSFNFNQFSTELQNSHNHSATPHRGLQTHTSTRPHHPKLNSTNAATQLQYAQASLHASACGPQSGTNAWTWRVCKTVLRLTRPKSGCPKPSSLLWSSRSWQEVPVATNVFSFTKYNSEDSSGHSHDHSQVVSGQLHIRLLVAATKTKQYPHSFHHKAGYVPRQGDPCKGHFQLQYICQQQGNEYQSQQSFLFGRQWDKFK